MPSGQVDAAIAFWTAAAATSAGEPRGACGEFVPLSGSGADPCLWIQRVDRADGEAGWHPDLLVAHLDGAVGAASTLGASVTRAAPGVVALTSPAGQPFCLVADGVPRTRPTAQRWPGGHHSLLDQVCLDIPASGYDAEARFWTELTGWARRAGTLPEFDYLVRPSEIPLRVLLQRLGDEDAGPMRAHLDFACEDVRAERRRHETLGATTERVAEHWSTMRDPVGLLYCLTDRAPA